MNILEKILELVPGADCAVRESDPGWEDHACIRVRRGPYLIDWKKTNSQQCPSWEAIQAAVVPERKSKKQRMQEMADDIKNDASIPKKLRDFVDLLRTQ